jgi:hypothetical protein
MMKLKPSKGGFLRPFGAGWFIQQFLMGKGPEGSPIIDPATGAAQSDICYWYKESLARATAMDRSEKIISDLVINGKDVSDEEAEEIYIKELRKISRKHTHMRYHSFLVYFGVLKRLGWVETTGQTEPSSLQDNFSSAPDRVYFRLTPEGLEAPDKHWANPLFTLYPHIGASHLKKTW